MSLSIWNRTNHCVTAWVPRWWWWWWWLLSFVFGMKIT